MLEIEYWNKEKEGLTREEMRAELHKKMMRSKSGKALLEKEALEKREKEKDKREPEIRSYTPSPSSKENDGSHSTFTHILRSMMKGKHLPADARKFDEIGDNVLMSSGVSTGYGFHLPLETRDLLAKDVPVASFIAKYNKAIRDCLVLTRLGASVLNVTGCAVLPTYTGSTSTWKGEIAEAGNGKGAFTKKELTPKRITTKLTVSRQLLEQNGDIDDFLVTDLAESVSAALEAAVFGKHEHTDIMPDGLFTNQDPFTFATGLADIVCMEEFVKNNGQPIKYCMNSRAEKMLKIIIGVNDPIIYNGLCNGYPYAVTDAVPTIDTENNDIGNGIIFGRWSDLVIAQWGGIEILFNPYTKATTGECEFIVNSYYDFTYRPESFAIGAIK